MRQLLFFALAFLVLLTLFTLVPTLSRLWLPQALEWSDRHFSLLQAIGCFVAVVIVVALGSWRARSGGHP